MRLLTGLSAFFLLPLWIDPLHSDPTRQGRFLLFSFLMALLLVMEVLPTRYRRRRGWDLLYAPLVGLGLLFLVHLAVDPYIPGAFGRQMEKGAMLQREYALRYIVRYGSFLVLVFFVASGRFGPRFPRKAINLAMIVSIPVALYAVLQFLGVEFLSWQQAEDRLRVIGTMGNPLFLADYMAVCIVLFLGNLTRRRGRRWVILPVFSVLLLCFALYASESRGALIALFFGGASLGAIRVSAASTRIRWRRIFVAGIGAVVIIAVIVAVIAAVPVFHPLVERFQDAVSLSDFSVLSRLILWQVAVREWAVSPWIGAGMEQFRLRYLPVLEKVVEEFPQAGSILATSKVVAANEAHGDYVQILAEWGVIGLALFTFLLAVCLARSAVMARDRGGWWKPMDRKLAGVIFAATLTICFEMLYGFQIRIPSHALLLFTFIGISGWLWTAPRVPAAREVGRNRTWRSVPVAAIGVLVAAHSLTIYRAESAAGAARMLSLRAGAIQAAERYADLAYRLEPSNGDFAFLYALSLWEQGKDPDRVLKLFDRALLTSTNTRVPVAKGMLLMKLDRNQEAYRVLQDFARFQSPLEGLHHARGLIYFLRHQYPNAVEELETEVRLYPRSYQAYIYLAMAYLRVEKPQLAIEALKGALHAKPRGMEAHIQLGEVYLSQGEYYRAQQELRQAKNIAAEVGDWETEAALETRLRQIRLERERG